MRNNLLIFFVPLVQNHTMEATGIFKPLFSRELAKLEKEIGSYTSEQKIWTTTAGISNSAGNLAMHLAGNLNHFVGSIIGETGYQRNREAEFTDKDLSKTRLLEIIDDTKKAVETSLEKLSDTDLDKPYPVRVFDYDMSTRYFLIHLLAHLSYHLGQINYHRRMLDHVHEPIA